MHWVEQLCRLFAIVGGLVLMATATMTILSVVGRALLSMPIRGDFEFTKLAMGFVIATHIPYCILNGGNLIVDFFTTKLSDKSKRVLDTLGALATGAGLYLFAIQTTVAIADVRESNEVAGQVDFPIWWIYAAMAPCLWLAVAASLVLAIKNWQGETLDSEAEALIKTAGVK